MSAAAVDVSLRTSVLAIEGMTAIVCADEAQTSIDRGAPDHPRARRLRPPGRLPRLDAARRAHRRRRADAGQDPARPPRPSASSSPAVGPVALAFPAQLHHYGRHHRARLRGRPTAPGRATSSRCSAPPVATARCCATPSATAPSLLRARIPLRYRRIVISRRGRGPCRVGRARRRRRRLARHARVPRSAIACDTLCLGYGFLPSVELLRLAGCALDDDEDRGGAVARVDEWMRTSVAGVLAAGDGTGVEGSLVALDEGRLAALGAALDLGALTPRQADAEAAPTPAAAAPAACVPAGARSACTASAPESTSSRTDDDGDLPLRGGHARGARPGDRRRPPILAS